MEPDLRLDAALEREWKVLRAGVDSESEARIMAEFKRRALPSLKVCSASDDPLGCTSATSRFGAVEAVLNAWATDSFHSHDPSHPVEASLVAGPVPGNAGYESAYREAADALNASGPARPETILSARALLGRVYHRLIKPESPRAWVQLLAGSGSVAEAPFCSACDALVPGLAVRLLDLARASLLREEAAGSVLLPAMAGSRAASPGRPEVRQLVGRSVTTGSVSGQLHTFGSRPPGAPFVLACDRVVPGLLAGPDTERVVAIVERFGAACGIGSVFALRNGLPHLYGVEDLSLLPGGSHVTVNADTRLITAR